MNSLLILLGTNKYLTSPAESYSVAHATCSWFLYGIVMSLRIINVISWSVTQQTNGISLCGDDVQLVLRSLLYLLANYKTHACIKIQFFLGMVESWRCKGQGPCIHKCKPAEAPVRCRLRSTVVSTMQLSLFCH